MQIRASITKTSFETVEVVPIDVLVEMRAQWRRGIGVPSTAYINREFFWEEWDSGPHGSGTTEVLRSAELTECRIEEAFTTVIDTVKRKVF